MKGLSHKDIARARGIGEATARQQATAVYRKAGVEGRNDLAAFFLEDLALPMERIETITDDPHAGATRVARRLGSAGDGSD